MQKDISLKFSPEEFMLCFSIQFVYEKLEHLQSRFSLDKHQTIFKINHQNISLHIDLKFVLLSQVIMY